MQTNIRYGIEIDTNTTRNIHDIGMVNGVMKIITGKDYFSGWFTGILSNNGISNPIRKIDLSKTGDYNTAFNSFSFSIFNDNVWDLLRANNVKLTNKKVTVYVILDQDMSAVWNGEIVNNPFNDVNYTFMCRDNSKRNHSEFPPNIITAEQYPKSHRIGDRIPVCIGDVPSAKLMKTAGDTAVFETLLSNGFKEVPAQRYTSSLDGSKTSLSLRAPDAITFISRNYIGMYIYAVKGGNPNPSSSRGIRIISYSYAGGTLHVTLDEPLNTDKTTGEFTHENCFDSDDVNNKDTMWWFSISHVSNIAIISDDSIKEIKLNADKKPIMWDISNGVRRPLGNYANSYSIQDASIDTLNSSINGKSVGNIIKANLEASETHSNSNTLTVHPMQSSSTEISRSTEYDLISSRLKMFDRRQDTSAWAKVYAYIGYRDSESKSEVLRYTLSLNATVDVDFNNVESIYVPFDIHTETWTNGTLPASRSVKYRYTAQVVPRNTYGKIIVDDDGETITTPVYTIPVEGYISAPLVPAPIPYNDLNAIPNDYYSPATTDSYWGTLGPYGDISNGITITDSDLIKNLNDSKEFELRITVEAEVEGITSGELVNFHIKHYIKQIGILLSQKHSLESDVFVKVKGETYTHNSVEHETNRIDKVLLKILNTYDNVDPAVINVSNIMSNRNDWIYGRQFNTSTNTLDVIKTLCKQSFISGFRSNAGNVKFSDWTDNEVSFNHNNSNILRDSIKNYKQTDIKDMYNQLTVRYGWDASLKKFNKEISIRKIDQYQFPGSSEPWSSYVSGLGSSIDSYNKAKEMWDRCHKSYIEANVINELPQSLGDLKWAIDDEHFNDAGAINAYAYAFINKITLNLARLRYTVSYQIPLTPDNLNLDLGDKGVFTNNIYTNNEGRDSWVESIGINIKDNAIDITLIVAPEPIQVNNTNWDIYNMGNGAIANSTSNIYDGQDGNINNLTDDIYDMGSEI